MTTNALDDLRLVRSRDAAELLAVSRRSLDRLVATGTLVPVRLHERGHRRFRLADVIALANPEEEPCP
jgi:excisionase family DNA binding protein